MIAVSGTSDQAWPGLAEEPPEMVRPGPTPDFGDRHVGWNRRRPPAQSLSRAPAAGHQVDYNHRQRHNQK